MFTVAIDTREKNPWNFDFSSLKSEVTTLKTGDYSIVEILQLEEKLNQNILRIERKASTNELAGNLGRKQKVFFNELERLKLYKHKFLILEFSLNTLLAFPEGSGIPKKHWYRTNAQGRRVKNVKMNGKYMASVLGDIERNFDIEVIFAGDRYKAMIIAEEIFNKVFDEFKEEMS